jgi:hypothetical protein
LIAEEGLILEIRRGPLPSVTETRKKAWDRGDRDQFLVDTLEEPIRYTEGTNVGIKR